MGSFGTRRVYQFTIPRKWAWLLDEANETVKYRRIGNVSRFDSPGQETFTWEDLDRDWSGDLDETDEW